MKFVKRHIFMTVLALTLFVPGITFAEYPDQPITYTIPFNPGGYSFKVMNFFN